MSCQGNSWRNQWKPASAARRHCLLTLGRLDLFVQEDVDAEGVEVGVPHRRVRRQVQPPAQQISAEIGQPFDLREEAFFAGEVEERGPKRLPGQDYACQQQADHYEESGQ